MPATAILFGLAAAASPAGAIIIANPTTWTVGNANFDGGGTLTGSFQYNGSTYSNVDLTTSGLLNPDYDFAGWSSVDGANSNTTELTLDAPGSLTLVLHFTSALTSAGGTINLVTSTDTNGSYVDPPPAPAYLTSGDVSATPEPASFATALLGALGLIGGTQWRKKLLTARKNRAGLQTN
jgi:hypothetical protein